MDVYKIVQKCSPNVVTGREKRRNRYKLFCDYENFPSEFINFIEKRAVGET